MQQTFLIRDETLVRAPADRLFKLSTDISLVRKTLKMRPVAGRTTGCVTEGDTVLWRGFKFGLGLNGPPVLGNSAPE